MDINSVEFLKKILDELPALVYINELKQPNDPDSIRNVYLNQYGHDFIGYTRSEIDEMGSGFLQKIIHKDDLEIIPQTIKYENKRRTGEFFASLHRLQPKGSEDFFWHYDHGVTIENFQDGSPKRALVVSVNITNSIITQNQLKASLKEISRLKYALKLSSLTNREKEILHLIVKGKTDKEISSELYISLKTAKKHRSNLIQKVGVNNTAELVAFAVEAGEY